MGLVLTTTKNPVVFSELGLQVNKDVPIYVEDDIVLFADVKNAIDKGIISAEPVSEYLGVPTIDKSSTKQERDNLIEQNKKQLEQEKERRRHEAELVKEMNRNAAECGVSLAKGGRFNAEVKAKFGYGIALFDCDLPHDDNDREYLEEVLWSKDFIKFAEQNKVFITSYKCEDCNQVWLVDGKTYVETADIEFLSDKNLKANEDAVTKVYKELCKIIKDKYSIDMPTWEPKWMLHLYYE